LAFRADNAPQDNATAAFYSALADDDPDELYDNAPCAYLSALPDGTIIKANATFLAWTGYDRDALLGRRRFQDLLTTGDRIFYETHAAPMLHMQGMLREIAVQVIGASGSRLPMLMNALLKRDDGGHPLVIRAVMFDASERLAYERELIAARRLAEESGSTGPCPRRDPAEILPAPGHRDRARPGHRRRLPSGRGRQRGRRRLLRRFPHGTGDMGHRPGRRMR
jgi:PAS domain S-box-containing protein